MTKFEQHRNPFSSFCLTLGIVILVSLPTRARAQEAMETPRAHLLTLDECVTLALAESPTLEASRFDVASASEEVRAEKGKLLPQLTAQYGAEEFEGSPTSKFAIVNVGTGVGIAPTPTPSATPRHSPMPRPERNNSRGVPWEGVEVASARFSYPLFKDGSILGLNNGPSVLSAEAKKRQDLWTVQLRRTEVIDRITDAFITTVSAQNRAGYAERRVKLLDLLVRITEEQQKQGLSLPIDLKVARVQLSGARTLAKVLREQATAGSIELSRNLGFDSPAGLHLDPNLPDPPDPPSAEELLGSSLNQHPSLQVQRAVIDKAREEYRLERFRLYPTVNLDSSAVYIDDFGSSDAHLYEAGVTVNVPIFDSGAQLALTRAKLLAYKAERARLLSVADDVTFEIVKTYEEIYVLSQNILSLQEEVAKADRDLQVISSQQQQGISPPLTAIDKELHLIAKKDDLDGLEVRRLILYAALQKAAGGSWQWVK